MPSQTLQILLFRFNGKFNLPVSDLASLLGYDEQYCRNLISENRFQIHTFLQGGKRVARIDDVADYLDRISSKEPPKRRGPKTKAQKIAEAKAEVSYA